MQRSEARKAICVGIMALMWAQVAFAQTLLYLPIERQMTGRRVRSAFNESAAPSGAWTVEVRRGKTRLALGVIVSSNGQIVTKLSQLEPAPGSASQLVSTSDSGAAGPPLLCRLPGGKVVEAAIVATDTDTDLALLKVEQEGLKTADWARDFDARLGRWVVSPNTGGVVASVGIISAARRSIPAEKVSGVLGVQLELGGGVARIREVFEDSGAKAAGLKAGDVITRCDDRDIPDGASLIARLRTLKPGEEVTLRVRRDEKFETIKVTLTHPFGIFLSQFAQQNRMGTELSRRTDGFEEVFSHDGPVEPDECGGPLLDLNGRVIGLNIARAGRTETLALPAYLVDRALERMQDQINTLKSTNVSTEARP